MQRNSFRWYRVLPFLLCMAIISFPYTTHGEHILYSNSRPEVCRDKIPQVVKQFVQREFSEQLQGFAYKPPIGILCHESRPLENLTEITEKKLEELIGNNSANEKIRKEWQYYTELFQSIITEHDDMFDVLIIVHLLTGKSFWGIFHIHFAYTGEFVHPLETSPSDWKQLVNGDEWQQEWCTLWIGKDQLEEHRCLQQDKTPAP